MKMLGRTLRRWATPTYAYVMDKRSAKAKERREQPDPPDLYDDLSDGFYPREEPYHDWSWEDNGANPYATEPGCEDLAAMTITNWDE